MRPDDYANTLITQERLAELRYQLRTPIGLLIGYCTTMLEDVGSLVDGRRREAVEAAREAAREALAIIDGALPGSRLEVQSQDIAALYQSLRGPQQRVSQSLATLFAPAADVLAAEPKSAEPAVGDAAPHSPALTPDGTSAVPPAASAAPESGAVTASTVARESHARILVADDDPDVRHALTRLLQREGYTVDGADHGRAALQLVGQRPYDVVLLDITMPEFDGYETLERLKDNPATHDIPVLMISAVDDVHSVVRCIERGAEDHLSKPFEQVVLRARIRACLEKKRLRDSEKEYLHQVNEVIEAASAVERGTYESGRLSQVAVRADELGRLARVLDHMAAEVRVREERLLAQVRDLRLEIEQVSPEVRKVRRSSTAVRDLPQLLPGQLFAERYEILEQVGRGGMGTVYRAHDRKLDEDVAIKTLDPDLLERSASLIERFKTEIRIARRISHRNVVRTHDFGEWEGHYYLTMEYVEGITLRELIDTRGQVGISSTLAIGTQLAESLDIAHNEGVVHRDVKPANLLLDEDGVLKVMDFGVACLAERTRSLTRDGTIVGTPAYMAPEQMLGGDVDARGDLYSAGAVLYECLTGRLPFEVDNSADLIVKLLEEEVPSPGTLNPEVPPALSALVVRLLSLRPDDRVRSAADLGEQLAQLV